MARSLPLYLNLHVSLELCLSPVLAFAAFGVRHRQTHPHLHASLGTILSLGRNALQVRGF